MFEVNPACEVTAIIDIGPDNRSAMIIDNFYENPHEVRKLALDLPRSKNIHFTNHHSGLRAALDTLEVRKNISRILFELLSDQDHWGRPTDMAFVEKNMELMWFLVDFINEDSITEEPLRLLPFLSLIHI